MNKHLLFNLWDKVQLRLNGKPVWHQFKIDMTNDSSHFALIKNRLLSIANNNSKKMWVTNYRNQDHNYILFRVKSTEKQAKHIDNRLNVMRNNNEIIRSERSVWNPASDAHDRIQNLARLNINPNTTVIMSCDITTRTINTIPNNNIEEREKQLTQLFETVGECTKVIYTNLSKKPDDPWAMSLFIHLLLNSMDFRGPDPPSEESNIRNIPPF